MMAGRDTRTFKGGFTALMGAMTAAIGGLAVFAATSSDTAFAQGQGDRVLAIGGSVTEIVFALGQGDRLVARDTTSSYPPEASELPDVGYIRALSPEGVLSVNPDLIVSEEGAGPPEALEVLAAAAIDWVTVPEQPTADGVAQKIRAVGAALGVEGQAETLAAKVAADMAAAAEQAARHQGDPKRVLFILSTEGGRIMTSGTDTAAAAIIDLAGGVNAIDDFEGYKPLTDEAVSHAAPDVILMMDRGGDHGAADDELFAMPALVTTPAAQTRSVIRMDGLYLLGFGPRTAKAVTDLNEQLYGG